MKRLLSLAAVVAVLALAPLAAFAQGAGFCPANSFGHASAPITTLPYTIGGTDECKTKVINSSGAGVVNLPAPGTAGMFQPNFPVFITVIGAGTVTLTPLKGNASTTPTINGATTLAVAQNAGGLLVVGADGNWYFVP